MVFVGILVCMAGTGCGSKATRKEARAAYAELVKELQAQAEESLEYYEPVQVDMLKHMPGADELPEHLRSDNPEVYVQFAMQRLDYDFRDPDLTEEPFTATVTETDSVTKYVPVLESKYKDYEKETGTLYDPADDGIESTEVIRVRQIHFEYNPASKQWEEKGETTVIERENEEEEE